MISPAQLFHGGWGNKTARTRPLLSCVTASYLRNRIGEIWPQLGPSLPHRTRLWGEIVTDQLPYKTNSQGYITPVSDTSPSSERCAVSGIAQCRAQVGAFRPLTSPLLHSTSVCSIYFPPFATHAPRLVKLKCVGCRWRMEECRTKRMWEGRSASLSHFLQTAAFCVKWSVKRRHLGLVHVVDNRIPSRALKVFPCHPFLLTCHPHSQSSVLKLKFMFWRLSMKLSSCFTYFVEIFHIFMKIKLQMIWQP